MDDDNVVSIPLDQIDPMLNQSRDRFDTESLQELSDNLKALGQLQPGVATFDEGRKRYTLICGERRFRALKLAGLTHMTVRLISGDLSQGDMLAMNLAENIQRASLNAIERAKAFQKLMRLENLSATDVASRMNVSNATVSRDLSLLSLSAALQQRVMSGELPGSVAATIARAGDETTQRDLADRYASGLIGRSDVEAHVSRQRSKSSKSGGKPVRLKLNGVSVTVSGKQLSLDTLLAVLTRLHQSASELKKARPAADVTALASTLKAS